MKRRSIGLKSITVGEVVPTGGMPAVMLPLGRTFKGSANFTTEADTVQEFFCEEEPTTPVEVVTSEFGLKSLTFNLLEWDNDTLIKILGGTTKTVTIEEDGQTYEVEKYVAPSQAVEIEKAVRVVTPKRMAIDIPRAKIIARFVWNLARTEIAQIEVVCRALTPNVATDGPYEIYSIPEEPID